MCADQVLEDFRAALHAHGILPPERIEADGQLHRCDVDARNGKGDAAYVLHLDGIPAGGFQNWQSGVGWQDWCSQAVHSLTIQEREQLRAKVEQSRRQREAESAARATVACKRARGIWDNATAAPADHPYLTRKGVQPHELRLHSGCLTIRGMSCDGALVMPLRDASGELHSLEFITGAGEKRFLPGGRKSGCYFAIGKQADVLVIAEGFATAASIHEATGHAVACALDAGNLEPVAKALRSKLPGIAIIIAADNDTKTGGANVGIENAQEAARAVGGLVAIPELDGGKCDFNDMMQAQGAEAVRVAIESARVPPADVHAQARDVPPTALSMRRASEIEIEPVSWLWPGWLASGKLHVLAGVPGTGKTTIALSLAATVTHGGRWPDSVLFPSRGNVVMWSGEDDPADTLVPRLAAMGADLDRVHFVGDCTGPEGTRPFDPAHDMPALIAKAREVGDVRLLIVDPIVTAVRGDSHKNAEVRRGLAPLVTFGQELRAAVLGVSHFSKGTGGRDPLERLTGSLAFGALARLVFGAVKKINTDGEEESRVLVRIKSNIGPDGGAIGYSLASAELPHGIVTSRVAWGEKIEGSARDIFADAEQTDAEDGRGERDEAGEFLRTVLAAGPVRASQVLREAREAGHSERTIRRAKNELNIAAVKEGMGGGWVWTLPKAATEPEDGHAERVAAFGDVGSLRDAEQF